MQGAKLINQLRGHFEIYIGSVTDIEGDRLVIHVPRLKKNLKLPLPAWIQELYMPETTTSDGAILPETQIQLKLENLIGSSAFVFARGKTAVLIGLWR